MGLYTVTVESFRVAITRSRIEDTDHVAAALQVGNETLPAQSLFTGDVGGGDVPIGMVFGPRLISQDDTVAVLSYSVYNGDTSKLPKTLDALASELGKKARDEMIDPQPAAADITDFTDYPGNPEGSNASGQMPTGSFEDKAWYNAIVFVDLASFLFPDCDGFVAMGTLGKSKKRWDALIDAAGETTFRQTIWYPGTESPQGCGRNSQYYVTWSVRRERVTGPSPHSLRRFLSSHQLIPRPGLRSLIPGESKISVRGLMV
jgi:hypothetical protein